MQQSQDISPIVTAIAATAGVIIGSIISVVGTWLNNRNARRLQREQWEREDKKNREIAEQQRKESESERKAKYREYLQELYSDCIQYLSAIYSYVTDDELLKSPTANTKLHDNLQEAQKRLSLLAVHSYDRENKDYKQFFSLYSALAAREDFNIADQIRLYVIRLMENDPRLKEV